MNEKIFQNVKPNVVTNKDLRDPQKEGYKKVVAYYKQENAEREISMVLPVGWGKSGLISMLPFSIKAKRALVVAPNKTIRDELKNNLNPTHQKYFYTTRNILNTPPYPEMVAIENPRINQSILDVADIVVTNIGQLQRENNRWLNSLPDDYFDVILFDEAHHNPADSWVRLKNKFPNAKIFNFSATPRRADGQLMSGEIIYQYPIYLAVKKGYVKKIFAWMLNPETLKYINKDTGEEYQLTLNEIREKAKNDSNFRNSIGQSEETLNTIIDTSIRALEKIREETGDKKHKIIAAAQNYNHCHDIVRGYKARGLRVEYIHSKEDSKENERVKEKLNNNELDVIVQVNMLGEGFDHPYLSVAAVFKIFASLSPFVQFVGRIMRVVQNGKNEGIVVFHVGSNIAKVWEDFQDFSGKDQDYYDKLLPDPKNITFKNGLIEREPTEQGVKENPIEISEQGIVSLSEMELLNPKAKKLLEQLRDMGITEEVVKKSNILKPVYVGKQKQWEADLKWIDSQVKNATGKLLAKKKLSAGGRGLDKKRLGKDNYEYVIAEIQKTINGYVKKQKRADFTIEDVKIIKLNFKNIISSVEEKIFNG